ncbi:hypothetical protein JHK82_046027 [Glycine max]|nr:hypothetical protein JHK85_044958 [Glycine max]KAG5100975.1 hypothetical protein JHK82_046027 [Glycine max]
MAQFTTQGRLKLLFNGEGVSSVLEHNKDPFLYNKCRSVQTHKRRTTRCIGSSARIYYVSSSLSNKTHLCNAEAWLTSGNGSVHDEYDDDVEDDDDDVFDRDGLSCFRGLVLDIAYRPVNVVGWKRAICLEFMEKADVLEYYAKTVNSPSGSFYIPAVLRVPQLLQVVKRRIVKNNLSRKNILFRDNYTCQYCSSHENLTIDHVMPTALGGEWTWENLHCSQYCLPILFTGCFPEAVFSVCSLTLFAIRFGQWVIVTACAKCNCKKGRKTLEEAKMKLIKPPKVPKDYDILAIPLTAAALRMLTLRKGTPEEWRQYLRSP